MKIRESGMPAEEMWGGFFNAEEILRAVQVSGRLRDVADFGCGYGTFAIPAAKMVRGKVYAIDMAPEMVEITRQKAERSHLDNVEAILRDFVSEGSGLEDGSVDYVMLFNILHAEEPVGLLKEAYRILRHGGQVGIIHWNHDSSTPRGPPMEIRPKPEQVLGWAKSAGFAKPSRYELKPYHYGIVMEKMRKGIAKSGVEE